MFFPYAERMLATSRAGAQWCDLPTGQPERIGCGHWPPATEQLLETNVCNLEKGML